MLKICKFCGKEYKGRKESNYCGSKCQHDSLIKEHEIKTCKFCGKEFNVIKGSKQIFCSLDCSNKNKRKKVELNCPVCGKLFYRKPSEITGRNCCSVSCSSKLTKNRLGTAKTTTTICETCQIEFEHPIYQNRKFCSSKCEKLRKDKNQGRSQKILSRLFEEQLLEKCEMEYRFDDLKYKKKLPIDILFLDSKIAIEFNGKHHYDDCDYLDSKVKFQQMKDDIKRNYLIKNNFTFVEWPYYVSLSKRNVKYISELISSQDCPSYINVGNKVQRLDGEDITTNNPSTSAEHPIY